MAILYIAFLTLPHVICNLPLFDVLHITLQAAMPCMVDSGDMQDFIALPMTQEMSLRMELALKLNWSAFLRNSGLKHHANQMYIHRYCIGRF